MAALIKNNMNVIVTIATLIGGFILQWGSLKSEIRIGMTSLNTKTDTMQRCFENFSDKTATKNNEQDQRITKVETLIDIRK